MLRWTMLSVVMVCCCSVSVCAASYEDGCEDTSGDSVRSYGNFLAVSQLAEGVESPVLAMQGEEAWAVYRVSGAQTARLRIYAANSSVASPAKTDAYSWGCTDGASVGGLARIRYDSGRKQLFLRESGQPYFLCYQISGLLFKPLSGRPEPSGGYYGLNVQASTDGSFYRTVEEVALTGVRKIGYTGYYEERYQAQLPAGASYIRVSLRGSSQIMLADGAQGNIPNDLGEYPLLLAAAAFEGDALHAGPPEPPEEPEPPEQPDPPEQPEPSSSEEESSSQQSSSTPVEPPSIPEETPGPDSSQPPLVTGNGSGGSGGGSYEPPDLTRRGAVFPKSRAGSFVTSAPESPAAQPPRPRESAYAAPARGSSAPDTPAHGPEKPDEGTLAPVGEDTRALRLEAGLPAQQSGEKGGPQGLVLGGIGFFSTCFLVWKRLRH